MQETQVIALRLKSPDEDSFVGSNTFCHVAQSHKKTETRKILAKILLAAKNKLVQKM